VPGGDAALLVQVRQRGQVGQAVVVAGVGHHPLAARLAPGHEHRPRLRQLVQALDGDPVGVAAAPRRGQVGRGEEVGVGQRGRQRGRQPGHAAADRGGQRHHDDVDDHHVLQ
jgi:hypothetical protein